MVKRIMLAGITSAALNIIFATILYEYQLKAIQLADPVTRFQELTSLSQYSFFQYLILAVCIVGGLWLAKARGKGIITFAQCIVYGVLIALVSGVIFGTYTYLFMTELHPELIETSKQMMREYNAKAAEKLPMKEMEEQLDMITPGNMLKSTIIVSTFISIVVSAVAGAFIHRRNPREETLL